MTVPLVLDISALPAAWTVMTLALSWLSVVIFIYFAVFYRSDSSGLTALYRHVVPLHSSFGTLLGYAGFSEAHLLIASAVVLLLLGCHVGHSLL